MTVASTLVSTHQLIATDRIEGTVVRRPNGDKIGTIERLMLDKVSGTVAYAVMEFGGFLGLGSDHYPIPWALLKYDTKIGGYELDVTEDVLSRAPKIDFGDRSEEIKLHGYYRSSGYWGAY